MKSMSMLCRSFLFVLLLIGISFCPVLASVDGVEYHTHVENEGWQDYVQNGTTSGTTGQCLRLEAIQIRLINPFDMGVEYRSHVQDIGWQDWVSSDELSGTVGEGKRLEAISIRLAGPDSPNYNIFYRVHAEDYGWLGWATNGQDAGTSKQAKRLEAIEIIVQPASDPAPTSDQPAYIEGNPNPPQPENTEPQPDQNTPLHYRAYLNRTGWEAYAVNGQETGSPDERNIECLQFGLNDATYQNGGIIYKKLGGAGWTPWLSNDDVAGAPNDAVQAIRIQLTSKLAYLYDIYYRVHVPNIGWTNWAKNGEACGSEGFNRGITLVQAYLSDKANAPQPTGPAFTQAKWYWPLPGIYGLSTTFGAHGTSHHDGIDIPAAGGTPIHAVKGGTVRYTDYADGYDHSVLYGAFGNCVVIEHDSGEIVYYAHMSRMAATVGSHVNTGDVIGYVGTTGNSLGNHLHLEVYDSAQNLVDPMGFF